MAKASNNEAGGCAIVLGVLIAVGAVVKFFQDHTLLALIIVVLAIGGFVAYRVMKDRSDQEDAARRRHQRRHVDRHQPAFELLSLLAHADGKIGHVQTDIIMNYMSGVQGFAEHEDMFRSILHSSVPDVSGREGIIRRIRSGLTRDERTELAETVSDLMDTRRTHAPIVRRWFDDTLRQLGHHRPNDISPM